MTQIQRKTLEAQTKLALDNQMIEQWRARQVVCFSQSVIVVRWLHVHVWPLTRFESLRHSMMTEAEQQAAAAERRRQQMLRDEQIQQIVCPLPMPMGSATEQCFVSEKRKLVVKPRDTPSLRRPACSTSFCNANRTCSMYVSSHVGFVQLSCG